MSLLPLGYYGRKGNLAPFFLIPRFPDHEIYVEPFIGSAAVLLQKPRSAREIVSDLDGDLVNFLSQLRDKWYVLKPMCQGDYDREFYRFARRNFMRIADPLEAARHFFTYNRQAYRNLPKTPTWDPIKGSAFRNAVNAFPSAAARLAGVEIKRMHYRTALLLHGDAPNAFSYLDPPYLFPERPDSMRQRFRAGGIYRFDMGEVEKHLELLRLVKTLRGKVMISGYPSDLYDRELEGWRVEEKKVMSAQAGDWLRRERTEVIWMNY